MMHAKSLCIAFVCCQSFAVAVATDPPDSDSPPPAKQDDQPDKSDKPGSKPAKVIARPTVEPASLPAPALGLGFKDPRIVDAAKVVEHNEGEAAIVMLNEAIKGEVKDRDDADRQELSLGKAMVQMRAGKIADARSTLTPLTRLKQVQPDRASREMNSIPRRAQFLDVVTFQLPKAGKDEPPAGIKQEAWREALTKAGAKVREKHEEEIRQLDRSLKADNFADVLKRLEAARQLIEQLDCAREDIADEDWRAVAKAHSEAVEEAVSHLNEFAHDRQTKIVALRPQMFRSNLAPGWYPMKTVNIFNDCCRDLASGKDVAKKLCDHYDNAKQKWGGGGAFGRNPHIGNGFSDIPEIRTVALKH